jgi:2-dehydropantoate 2-reductase
MTFNNITIVGAGAIGGWLAVHMARSGSQVSVLARPDSVSRLNAQGLVLHEAAQQLSVPVKASSDAKELGAQDLVVLSVKAPALRDVAAQLPALMGPKTVVLCAMNGVPWWFLQGFGGEFANRELASVDADSVIARSVPPSTIMGCVVHASCSVDAPGVIRHHFGKGLIIGEPAGGTTPRAQALLELLQTSGFDATLSPQIQRDIWYKLWGNMTMNPISAITGATTDRILGDDDLRGFVSHVMLEAKAIGERLGIPIAQNPEDRHAVTRKLGAFKTSMLQDVESSKPVELDALVSSVQELGRITGVATPYTDALLGLARVHAQTRGLYPLSATA